jgi:hypothetical protein
VKSNSAHLRAGGSPFNNQWTMSPSTRTSQTEMKDILVWELVNVRCALAQPAEEGERKRLRKHEKSLVGALLDVGVLSEEAVAPLPPVVPAASQPTY